MKDEEKDNRKLSAHPKDTTGEGGWLGAFKVMILVPLAEWIGKTAASLPFVRRAVRRLPVMGRFALGKALKLLGGVIRIPWPADDAVRHLLNDGLDQLTAKAGEVLGSAGLVLEEDAKKAGENAAEARKRLGERECFLIKRGDRGAFFIHIPEVVNGGGCSAHERERHPRQGEKGKAGESGRQYWRVPFARARAMGHNFMTGADACACRKAYEAEEAEIRALERKRPTHRGSAADIFGRNPEQTRHFTDRIREIYAGEPAEMDRIFEAVRRELDWDEELLAFVQIKGMARAVAAAGPSPAMVAGFQAMLPGPAGAPAAHLPAGAQALAEAKRKVEIWLALLKASTGNRVAFQNPKRVAELIELLAEYFPNDWEEAVKVIHAELDSDDELSALLSSRNREELERMIRSLKEKSLFERFRVSPDAIAGGVAELRERLAEPLKLNELDAAVETVTNDLGTAASKLDNLRQHLAARRETLRIRRGG